MSTYSLSDEKPIEHNVNANVTVQLVFTNGKLRNQNYFIGNKVNICKCRRL